MMIKSSFGNPEAPTPHGGPAFHGWKNGWGFGKARGPGGFVMSPEMPMQLRFTPAGDRCFSASAFWRSKSEVGQASTFGIGDRPTYLPPRDGSVAPNNYGDVSRQLGNARRNVTRKGQTLKPRFPSMEERYRDLSWPKAGPGPGKYDIRIPPGQGSWKNPVAAPSWSMQSRPILEGELRQACMRPGPAEYTTRIPAGKNSPITHGTLYNIDLKGRLPSLDKQGDLSPGPARYVYNTGLAAKGLWEKIANVKVPPRMHRRSSDPRFMRHADEEEEEVVEDYEGRPVDGSGPTLTRVESSPAAL